MPYGTTPPHFSIFCFTSDGINPFPRFLLRVFSTIMRRRIHAAAVAFVPPRLAQSWTLPTISVYPFLSTQDDAAKSDTAALSSRSNRQPYAAHEWIELLAVAIVVISSSSSFSLNGPSPPPLSSARIYYFCERAIAAAVVVSSSS